MQHQIFLLLIIVCVALVIRVLTTLLHELGHAVTALLLTKQKVTIYVGSYGNPNKDVKFNIGAIKVYFRYNPFSWRGGLCIPSAKTISFNRRLLFILAGPLTSLIIASITFYFVFKDDTHWFLKFALVVFLISAVFDFFLNLIPNENPIKLYNGTIAYNDGYRLKQLFRYKRFEKEILAATDLYDSQQFSAAAVMLEKILTKGIKDENIYRLAVSSYLMDKNYKRAKDISDELVLMDKMNSDDFANMAVSYSYLGLHEKAMELYDQSLQLNSNNRNSLNNKGYTLNLLNRFEEAIVLFNKAIELDRNFAYSYSNRGLSKIKLGQTQEGLADIHYSLELDKDNAYGYKNLGVYHFDKRDYDEALRLFSKAKELGGTTHMIDELINETKQNLSIEHRTFTK